MAYILVCWFSPSHCAHKSVLGESVSIQCRVIQYSVLSPYVLSLYVDDIIRTIRMSGYDIYVDSVFAGCILVYADGILLLSTNYSDLKKW